MKMNLDEVKLFIYTDIEREIQLAKFSVTDKEILQKKGIHPGGGNFLAALGLLCYTEVLGTVTFDCSCSSDNFNMFFDSLGQYYKQFRKNHNVYKIFRCGLVHEYEAKKITEISIIDKSGLEGGLGLKSDGTYFFNVERYFNDFKKAFEKIKI